MHTPTIRSYRPGDLEAIKRLTVESFGGVTIEQNIEDSFGPQIHYAQKL